MLPSVPALNDDGQHGVSLTGELRVRRGFHRLLFAPPHYQAHYATTYQQPDNARPDYPCRLSQHRPPIRRLLQGRAEQRGVAVTLGGLHIVGSRYFIHVSPTVSLNNVACLLAGLRIVGPLTERLIFFADYLRIAIDNSAVLALLSMAIEGQHCPSVQLALWFY
jgi:hypothetical protein